MRKNYVVAVVGATGAVGTEMMKLLEERNFPIAELRLLSSERSTGKKVIFKGETLEVQTATPDSFVDVDIALFSAGGNVSKLLVPEAVNRGAVVIDNTSAFRMNEDVPLIVPEVNKEDLQGHKGIIANPNCSTIQMVTALEPIRKVYGLKKIIVSTYQAVSGAGNRAIAEMYAQAKAVMNRELVNKQPQIAFNLIPQIDAFGEDNYTLEEWKLINETKKIMHLPNLHVTATCVRVPIERGHSESVYIETEKPVDIKQVKLLLARAEGAILQDNPKEKIYPMPVHAVGKKEVFVGRLRQDINNDKGLHLWIVADNLLKGAAWNTVQIAEKLIEQGLL